MKTENKTPLLRRRVTSCRRDARRVIVINADFYATPPEGFFGPKTVLADNGSARSAVRRAINRCGVRTVSRCLVITAGYYVVPRARGGGGNLTVVVAGDGRPSAAAAVAEESARTKKRKEIVTRNRMCIGTRKSFV